MSNPEPIIDPEEPPGKGSNVSPRFRIEKRNGTAIRSSENPLDAYPRDMILSGSISRTYHVRVKKGFLTGNRLVLSTAYDSEHSEDSGYT